ncbi:mannose-1-phosphate guanyltransferase alpha-B-like [Corticium candelabrum]|uniref:mannose-1-phosphate guanyltransferase alpha-B-like n=1 Tax=Corticium candelabrum TaxID=121492 RepID=UPI002E2532C3|nr:mannose-1-phosphate guanyltransferase alpha-B-like [Corticium candelabrum]
MVKAVILVGRLQKGTRFRPLSLEIPKPLFPIAGQPMIQHHFEACAKVPEMKEIILIGGYDSDQMRRFAQKMQKEFSIPVRYLQEHESLGTAGGIYHFRDQILSGSPECFFLFNCDICCDFPLVDLLKFHREHTPADGITMMGTDANRKQAVNYGCIVENSDTHEVKHYVEKPETFVSSIINTGVYILSPNAFAHMSTVFRQNYEGNYRDRPMSPVRDSISLEQDIISPLAGTGKIFVYKTSRFWSQIKTAGSAIYANRLYLGLFRQTCPERLTVNEADQPTIIGDVRIHPTADINPTAMLGPNVYVGPGVVIRAGARVKESIILDSAELMDHCCVLHSIVGWHSVVGEWARVEGFPCDPNPNDPLARVNSDTVFNDEGRLNPSITILGKSVFIPPEVIVLNSIVLPHKELSGSYKNQIIL